VKKPIPFGKYYLLERINVGGMAEVFRAKAYGVEGFERLLAVKRILPNIAEDQEFITMFIDEAKIAVQLNHANIAQIFDLGVVDGSYFIAMEHIHGRDLRAIFERCRQRNEPMPIAQACFMAMKMCEGLDYAHNKRDQGGREMALVHRDVSPQNVIVSFEGEVKLIDFGIAKAAGKMGKTQAGILKGKFGYMSPEQVRGLPIDRRSDIFSTGIVLYELLTNERLFVGESDFSTLEKVRNVEILPPSTYNRKIPEELERIVLKALAKDVEDRYQNAIDLHDELQAFVYTAGEFYSRKDLAAWMKRTFVKEIEEEAAKLEQYRQLAPPEVRPPSQGGHGRSGATPPPQRRPTIAMAAASPPPPPPPGANGRASSAQPPGPKPAAAPLGSTPPKAAKPVAKQVIDPDTGKVSEQLEWDDEELETQIYDTPDGKPPGEPPAAEPPPMMAQAERGSGRPRPPGAPRGTGGSGAGLGAEAVASSPAAAPPPIGVPTVQGYSSPTTLPNGPQPSANGSGQTAQPRPLFSAAEPADPFGPPPAAEEPSAIVSMAKLGAAANHGIAESHAPPPSLKRESGGKKSPLLAALAGVAVLGAGAWAFFSYAHKNEAPASSSASAPAAPAEERQAVVAGGNEAQAPVVDARSGFEVWTVPAGATVKLDGNPVNGKTPFALTNLASGKHTIEVNLPGYQAQTLEGNVETGKTTRLDFKLLAAEATAKFTSEPAGAKVTLVRAGGARDVVGPTPASFKIDPTQPYEIVFEKDGFVTVTRPIDVNTELAAAGGKGEFTIAVHLERAKLAERGPARPVREAAPREAAAPKEAAAPAPPPAAAAPASAAAGSGTLMLGAKPQCKIYIDGKDTGLVTPQRSLELKSGTRKVTLVNNEFNIKETFTVDVKPGQTEKVIKDFSDRIPQ
jgi:eukaryotic-like serine/threonine-protein kinase